MKHYTGISGLFLRSPPTGAGIDHALLTNLPWLSGAHTGSGVAGQLAGFDGASAAAFFVIGTDVQAYSALLASIAALPSGDGKALVHEDGAIAQRIPAYAQVTYGNGQDGDIALDAVSAITVQSQVIAPVGGLYTLTADMLGRVVTFSSTAALRTAGWLACAHDLVGTAANVIHDDGFAAAGGTAGSALSAGGTLQRASGAGGAGRSTNGAGNTGGSVASAGRGSAGGAGGTAGANAGGASGTVTTPNLSSGRVFRGVGLLHGWLANGASGPGSLALNGGAGGGGGANSGGVGTSGGGGGGGGRCRVFAYRCSFAGTIRAAGGAGGDASGGTNGGGGGGGGGEVILVTEYRAQTQTLSAAGGAGGAGTGGGASGSSGTAGTTTLITAI